MNSNLATATNSDVVKRSLPLEPREGPLDSATLAVENPECLVLFRPLYSLLMLRVRVNDRFRAILPPNQPPQCLAAISSVRNSPVGAKRRA